VCTFQPGNFTGWGSDKVNQSSASSSRKLNVTIPRMYLFKSSLVYSGPALWNSLPSALRLPVSPSVFKKRLTLHVLSLLGVP